MRRELRRKGGPWDALSNPAVRNALTAQARQGACSRMHARVCACMCMCVCACECVRAPPAAAQRAVLTMAILTMATLTMATLTVAMLAMAIRAMAGRPDRGQLLPRLPRRPDMAAHPEGQGGPDPAPRWLGGTPHAEGGPGAPRGHHACARSPPRPHLAGPRGRRHPRAPPGGGGSTRGGGGGGGQEVAAALCPAHDGVAVRPACLRVARPGLLRSCLPSPPSHAPRPRPPRGATAATAAAPPRRHGSRRAPLTRPCLPSAHFHHAESPDWPRARRKAWPARAYLQRPRQRAASPRGSAGSCPSISSRYKISKGL